MTRKRKGARISQSPSANPSTSSLPDVPTEDVPDDDPPLYLHHDSDVKVSAGVGDTSFIQKATSCLFLILICVAVLRVM